MSRVLVVSVLDNGEFVFEDTAEGFQDALKTLRRFISDDTRITDWASYHIRRLIVGQEPDIIYNFDNILDDMQENENQIDS